jgi:hypothetical protein
MPERSYLAQVVRCESLVVRCEELDLRAEDYQAFQKCENAIAKRVVLQLKIREKRHDL